MNATRWLKLAAFAALVYVLYDFIPSPLPDLPGDVHRIVLSVLIVAVVLSGMSSMADRRAERERERQLAERPTEPLRWIARTSLVIQDDSKMDGYDRGWVDGLAARSVRDGGRRVLPFRE